MTCPIGWQGTSQTMSTLKNLVQKGVKVDLGMPLELWDEPSVEVTHMKKQVRTNKQTVKQKLNSILCLIFHCRSLALLGFAQIFLH